MLERLLEGLDRQETAGLFTFSTVVSDNDPEQSARAVAEKCASRMTMRIVYVTEAKRSISHARNKSLERADGDFVAFIDDDEFPTSEWLLAHYRTWSSQTAAGVFGPVRPHYDESAPEWVKRAGFYERPEHATGFRMPWGECRTGNVLVERRVLREVDPVFHPKFGGGASDQDLFRRLIERGHHFIWCNEAVVYEHVPLGRCKRKFLLRRALLRGAISLRHPGRRMQGVIKAVVAIPLYAMALPFLQLGGHHHFMKCIVRLCDHTGRLLALVGIEPVRVRDME